MSALRNATKRRTHKERAQPAARRGLGLLEKKKDYKQRADNYHKKQDALKTMRKKATERNPDEFYFKMTSTTANEPEARPESKMKHAEIVKLKNEDLRLIAMRKVVQDRKVEKMRATLHATEAAGRSNQKTLFVDDINDDPPPAAPAPAPTKVAKRASKKVRKAYGELSTALERKRKMAKTFEALQSEKNAMCAKGQKRKVKDAELGRPAVYKWKRVRAR